MEKQERDLTTIDTITPRQLRKILFHIDNEDMTVKELRARLFEIPNIIQDEPVSVDFSMSYELGLI
jgi:hypothetical protein